MPRGGVGRERRLLQLPGIGRRWTRRPGMVVVPGFAAAIALVTLLLLLPAAAEAGQHTTFREALFTATSAAARPGCARPARGRGRRGRAHRGVRGFRTAEVRRIDDAGRLVLVDDGGRALDPVDEVVTVTGFRPDLSWLSELRLELDATLQAPVALAPLIDPNVHSCGTVHPHGVRELSHPEPGVYLVGMKSYGRAPTFLAMTGYEQVRSVAAAIAGDRARAERVELTLPDTGVCGGSGEFDTDGSSAGGCCTPAAPELLSIGRAGQS